MHAGRISPAGMRGVIQDMKKRRSYLQKKLYVLVMVCLVPLTIMIVYLLILLNQFSDRYNAITDNITVANTYSINFKEDLDYMMYIIIVNMERAEEIMGTRKPHTMIEEANKDFQKLYHLTDSEYGRSQISGILKCLTTLDDRVGEIEEDALVSGAYDENMERLDLNIRVLTDLIQDRIQEYIYVETTHLEKLRAEIHSDVSTVLRTCILIFTVILFGALLFSRKIMSGITEPIRRLSEVTKQAGSGDFAVRAEEDSDDEMAVLNTSFNQMVEKIGQLVEDIRVEQINLRQSELRVLQAQINPHFLYNTLDSIIWLAESGQKDQVVEMVSSLSDFFRTTLSKGRDYITLHEEEMHIRSYLRIQQFRYRDILDYSIQIPQQMASYPILKLTLQPLVENALYHGIKNKRGRGHIEVIGREEEDRLVLSVRDDGIGMTAERLSHVRALICGDEMDEENPSGFGLFNVNQRLQLNYGTSYGLEIESVYGEGTTILAVIPKKS